MENQMKQMAWALLFLLPVLIISSIHTYGSFDSDSRTDSRIELDTILEKCAEYCERVAKSALFFVCREKIEEEIYQHRTTRGSRIVIDANQELQRVYFARRPIPIIEKNIYIYDYQLIKKREKIEESRILLEENKEKRYEKNAKLKTKRFYSKKSIFGPVGLLSKDWQEMYNYKIIKEASVNGREAFVIEATPRVKIEKKPNYGRVWVDKNDFSILKIEIEEESLVGFESFKEIRKRQNIKPIITVTHYYGIEKNGIRFPSQTVFEESYVIPKMGKFKNSKTTFSYDNYRFFTVDVEIKYYNED
jgi:hypothetical protein